MYEQIAVQKKLSEKFSDLRLKNPAYSLRAFSRKLGMSSSSVSEILNGKRRVSIKIVQRISDRLCLDPYERTQLISLFPNGKVNDEK